MNTKRVVGWVAFFAVAAALAWFPEFLKQADDSDPVVATVATPAKGNAPGASSAASSAAAQAPIKDLSPAGDLFAARSWKAAAVPGTVTEQPVVAAPVVQVPTAPPLPFQFVGRLDDRSDLQVFLQNGEKIYVVRKGDVIDETWRIERISDEELSLVYLPLHLVQTLSVGSTE
ncbi:MULTISPECIES: hypothetical protein [unclassified Pseudomonas]|uniref:hypothetical protein n=1 Tax=Pseudomonas sp. A-R-26 TaxID=2832404 RepID=UPI001CBCEFB9|nr:hypothetical protein [Pseudomonas sp. A-R-26]